MRSVKNAVLDGATMIAVLGAMVMVVTSLWDRYSGSTDGLPQDREVANSGVYAEAGHRIGPENAAITVVEFGDYQCPACRAFHKHLRRMVDARRDLAVVYRHWPLPQHEHAYSAARAAECAAEQGAFEEMHNQLYEVPAWQLDPARAFVELAEKAGVSDTAKFRACVNSLTPVPAIETDIQDVQALGSRGTPTILVNSTLLGSIPDSAQLVALIEEASR